MDENNRWPPDIVSHLERAALKWEPIIQEKIREAKSRAAKKRGWVVLRKSWLTSSINYRMVLSEIAIYSKLIVMADEFGPVPGLISDNDFRAMPYDYLAHQAYCPIELLKSTIQKSIEDDSIYVNGNGIFVTHFDEYQFTEYDRQKPYREKQKILQSPNPEKFNHGRLQKIVRQRTKQAVLEGDNGEE